MRASEIHEWDVVISAGILLLVCGTGAIVYAGTGASGPAAGFGWLLLFAGAVQTAHAMRVRAWRGFPLYLFDGFVRAAVGTLLIRVPFAGPDELMLILSFYLFAGGVFRATCATALEFPGWEWTAASGLLAVAVASMLALQWPGSRFLVGFAAGFDLIQYGWALVMYAATARRPSPSYARHRRG